MGAPIRSRVALPQANEFCFWFSRDEDRSSRMTGRVVRTPGVVYTETVFRIRLQAALSARPLLLAIRTALLPGHLSTSYPAVLALF